MPLPLPVAFSFPEWLCKDPRCRQRVSWADAIEVIYEDGKLNGFVHVDCEAPE